MFRPIPLDDALEWFDPQTGHRIRVDAPGTRGLRQAAPRSVQFSLSHRCNLGCAFCSRDADLHDAWTVEGALELLADLDRGGVAEVAFGGGEPLVFKGFFELVDRLVAETRLAVHLTTNGVLLTDDALRRLRGKVGEIRVSLYDDNDWRGTLARLRRHGARFGVNLLVTPDRLETLPAWLDELRALGCRDVLLLPMMGHPGLALSPDDARRLAALLTTRPADDLVLKLGVCWGDELAHLPRLFRASDCGAGKEFLEITADRKVRACSFHARAVPFSSAEDVLSSWAAGRAELSAPAGCFGCTRRDPLPRPTADPRPSVRSYTAFASNNSGSYTLLGSFETTERAAEIAALLNRVTAEMEATPDGNPLRDLLRSAGVDAPEHVGRGDDWPAEWSTRPEALQVDRQVWWFAEYTITMPRAIGHWFYAMGGRVQSELDHAHNPLLAHLSFWLDLPWNERRSTPRQPLIDALWRGPLAVLDAEQVRVRENEWSGIEVLWLGPTPEQMRELVRTAASLGLQCRLALSELPGDSADLDALW